MSKVYHQKEKSHVEKFSGSLTGSERSLSLVNAAFLTKCALTPVSFGQNSFASFQCHALPKDEPVLATLIYQDSGGKEVHLDYKLKERC